MDFTVQGIFQSWRMFFKGRVVSLCIILCMGTCSLAYANQPYANPESSPHAYGPDHQGSSSKRPMSGNSGRIDAYGNPVVPYEEEKKPSRRSILPKQEVVRPLPEGPQTDAGWQF